MFPPPRSPEPQPAERLSVLTEEGVVNRLFDTLDEPQGALSGTRELIRSHTLFHWWPEAA